MRATWLVGAMAMAVRAGLAHADATVVVNLNAQGQALAADLGDGIAELEQRVQDKIDSLYQLENLGQLLKAFGDGTQAADRGLGIDYAAHVGELAFGFAATGADAGGPTLGTSKASAGEIYNFGAFAGGNLATLGLPKLTVWINGYYETASVEQLTGHLTTIGAHAQWRVVDGRALSPGGRVQWVGLDVTSGVEYARDAVGASQGGIISHFTVDGDTEGESRNLTVNWAGTLTIDSSAKTIPVIATTGIRLGALDVYAGGGFDFVFGQTTITARARRQHVDDRRHDAGRHRRDHGERVRHADHRGAAQPRRLAAGPRPRARLRARRHVADGERGDVRAARRDPLARQPALRGE